MTKITKSYFAPKPPKGVKSKKSLKARRLDIYIDKQNLSLYRKILTEFHPSFIQKLDTILADELSAEDHRFILLRQCVPPLGMI